MVDRAALIKFLEPRVRPSASQAEAIRKALDKALADLLPTLPFEVVSSFPKETAADLLAYMEILDQKVCEKLSAAWEPKRKLDADLKRRIRKDLTSLLRMERPVYEPVKVSLRDAREGRASDIVATIQSVAPLKDLQNLAKSWDKHWKPSKASREEYENRLSALMQGAEPIVKPQTK